MPEYLDLVKMPSHGVMPYRLGMREKGDRDNFWNLTDLQEHDETLPGDHIIDYFEALLSEYHGTLDNNKSKEKTFLVDDYNINRSQNLVEGRIMTGDYGYTAELKNVNTGASTHTKQTDEAELVPYYFLFWLPETHSGNLYENGQRGIMVFQQFNGRSFKTAFQSRFYKQFFNPQGFAEDTMFELRPITTQKVLDKVTGAKRVKRAEFSVDKVPDSDEGKMQLVEGMDLTQTDRQSIVFKPKHGESLNPIQKRAKQLKRDDGSFTEIVDDPVEDFSVTITNEHGRDETFSLLEDELKMKKELDPSSGQLSGGHPKTDYIAKESVRMINSATPDFHVRRLSHTTKL